MSNRLARALALACLGTIAVVAFERPVSAGTITYQLNQNGCTGNCLPGGISGGTVKLTDGLEADEVQVLVTLANGFVFADSSGNGRIAFNVTGNPVIGIDDLNNTNDFALVSGNPGSLSMPPFGDFGYALVCTTCQGGQTTNPGGPVQFDVVLTGITVSSFVANSGGFFFATDVRAENGKTGNIAAIGPGGTPRDLQPIPEPASLVLLGTGVAAAAARLRRQSRADAA